MHLLDDRYRFRELGEDEDLHHVIIAPARRRLVPSVEFRLDLTTTQSVKAAPLWALTSP